MTSSRTTSAAAHLCIAVALVTGAALSGCESAATLTIDIRNQSDDDAILEIAAGNAVELEANPVIGFHEVVRANDRAELALEEPGPGGRTVLVNGKPVTDASLWSRDHPTVRIVLSETDEGHLSVDCC